jgi:phosphoribosyl 1,2-cyclic phosphate phosphodiesterase
MKVIILGCGASAGVPLITGEWIGCNPDNPKNRRRRSSIAVQSGGKTILVDTSPDLREQCISAQIKKVDAVLYTHDHADHTHGIDDLRVMAHRNQMPIPIYGNQETIEFLKKRFGYAFAHEELTPDIYRHFVVPNIIAGPFQIGDTPIVPFIQGHGYTASIGYRFDKIAYSTDVVELEDASFKALEGIDTWIVDCITLDPKPTHSHLEKTLSWIERVKPRRSILTHMSAQLDYDKLSSLLPEGVEPGYDGLVIEL